jgi:chromosome segregation ATPase
MGVVVVMMSGSAWAGNDSQSGLHATGAQTSQNGINRRVAKQQVAVKRLQQDVAKQESASKQASEHLQQQDQVIAELRRQLQEAQAKPADGSH